MNLKKLIQDSEYFVWLALGDSITEYNHCTEGYGNYLQHFDTLLRNEHSKRKYTIINTAISGSTLSGDVEFVLNSVKRFKPNFVTAMFGMNDSGAGEAGQEQFRTALTRLCALCKENGIPLVLISQNPLDYTCKIDCIQRRKNLSQYMVILGETAETYGVELVDIHGGWTKEFLERDNNEHFKLLHDGIHPNHKGHEYIFDVIRRQIYQ